jgi:dTDP-4-dehydrorhamnose reductase
MKILLIGNTGQLGWELQRVMQPQGSLIATDYPEINMADADSIQKTVEQHHPQVIFNASAYTAVDKAESEPGLAGAINGTGPGVLAEAAKKLDAVIIHYSTDYVFDGSKGVPYLETDHPNPLNVYGKTKLAGERAIQEVGGRYLIFRTAWVYSLRRENFVSKVLDWARKNEKLRIVDDQVSNPTWARMLAGMSVKAFAVVMDEIIRGSTERSGLYNLAADGYASRYQWAKKILMLDPHPAEQVVKDLLPASTTEFPSPAVRPPFSALDCTRFKTTFGIQLPPWEETLLMAMKESRDVPQSN